MNKKTNSSIINNIIPWIALIVSLFSAYFSWKANSISNESNVISREANIIAQNANSSSERNLQIEENRKLNENKEKSLNLIEGLYDKIMYQQDLYDVYLKTTNNSLNGSEDFLQRYVDEYEGLGGKYCQEQIYKTDLKTYISFFQHICNNPTIDQKFGGHKNGLSKICLDIVPNSKFGKHYNENSGCKTLK